MTRSHATSDWEEVTSTTCGIADLQNHLQTNILILPPKSYNHRLQRRLHPLRRICICNQVRTIRRNTQQAARKICQRICMFNIAPPEDSPKHSHRRTLDDYNEYLLLSRHLIVLWVNLTKFLELVGFIKHDEFYAIIHFFISSCEGWSSICFSLVELVPKPNTI